MTTASPRPASLGPLLGWRVPTVDEGRSEIFPSLVVGALLDLAREQEALPASLEKVAAIPTRAPTSAGRPAQGQGLAGQRVGLRRGRRRPGAGPPGPRSWRSRGSLSPCRRGSRVDEAGPMLVGRRPGPKAVRVAGQGRVAGDGRARAP